MRQFLEDAKPLIWMVIVPVIVISIVGFVVASLGLGT